MPQRFNYYVDFATDTRNLYWNDDDDTLQAHQSDHNEQGDVLAGNEAAFMENHRI